MPIRGLIPYTISFQKYFVAWHPHQVSFLFFNQSTIIFQSRHIQAEICYLTNGKQHKKFVRCHNKFQLLDKNWDKLVF